ncbi:hypothetical protein Metho_2671 (plasmid) [Methanomethylovorans hollandica DSM 15978]|jgi:chemotaxis methyl-accepting protein methylase|uniref:Uncharacterized protein n=1 Tax=Methanomethylovorans hollandica (strain DSM 15978 / NBRC 107637 / DMS1) TaxID=867904 RepID=L0L0F1_METHD|nr:hypothetical protein [Methanomethylovorans hollandica]AGB50801.1 hypothetical protein Metho_2671 [Methanomethylovorans hollandica DSM 15978]
MEDNVFVFVEYHDGKTIDIFSTPNKDSIEKRIKKFLQQHSFESLDTYTQTVNNRSIEHTFWTNTYTKKIMAETLPIQENSSLKPNT